QRMKERHRPDAGPHPDLPGLRRRPADHEIGAGKLIGRLPSQEGAVLADPGLGHAEPVGHDDLLEVLVVAELGDLVVAVAIGENADLHPLTSRTPRWSAGRARAVKRTLARWSQSADLKSFGNRPACGANQEPKSSGAAILALRGSLAARWSDFRMA